MFQRRCSYCPLLTTVTVSVILISGVDASGWSYSGEDGPVYWHKMGYTNCDGHLQSPINIVRSRLIPTRLKPIRFKYFNQIPLQMNLTNNKHTAAAQMLWRYTPTVQDGGLPGVFEVFNVHFHWGRRNYHGSEHTVDGESYPLELHMVCKNSLYPTVEEALVQDDGLAVLATFFQINESTNLALALMESAVRDVEEAGRTAEVRLAPRMRDLLPEDTSSFYRYRGSLTTPGCNEVVTWTIFTQPVPITAKQVEAFRQLQRDPGLLIGDNYRPPQLRHGRQVFLRNSTITKKPQEALQILPRQDMDNLGCTAGLLGLRDAVVVALVTVFVAEVFTYS